MAIIIILDPMRLAGGLCQFRNNDIRVSQSHSTRFYIETYVHELVSECKYWYILFIQVPIKQFIKLNCQNLIESLIAGVQCGL